MRTYHAPFTTSPSREEFYRAFDTLADSGGRVRLVRERNSIWVELDHESFLGADMPRLRMDEMGLTIAEKFGYEEDCVVVLARADSVLDSLFTSAFNEAAESEEQNEESRSVFADLVRRLHEA